RPAVGARVVLDQELFKRALRTATMRMIRGVSANAERLERVHHGRKDRAQPLLAVQPLEHPRFGPLERVIAQRSGYPAVEAAREPVEGEEYPRQRGGAPERAPEVAPLLARGRREELPDVDVARIPRAGLQRAEDEERHH